MRMGQSDSMTTDCWSDADEEMSSSDEEWLSAACDTGMQLTTPPPTPRTPGPGGSRCAGAPPPVTRAGQVQQIPSAGFDMESAVDRLAEMMSNVCLRPRGAEGQIEYFRYRETAFD